MKNVEKHTCPYCESEYKIIFEPDFSIGIPKFCPFCAAETYDDDIHFEEHEDEQ